MRKLARIPPILLGLLCLTSSSLAQLAPATPSARRPEWWAARVAGPLLTLQQYDTTDGRYIFELKNRNGTRVFSVDIDGNIYALGGIESALLLGVPAGGTGEVTFPVNSILIGDGVDPLNNIPLGTANQVLTVPSPAATPVWRTIGGDLQPPLQTAIVDGIWGHSIPDPVATLADDKASPSWNSGTLSWDLLETDLSNIDGILGVDKGGMGTNTTSAANGALALKFVSGPTNIWVGLEDVATGSVLVSGGVGTEPAYSTTPSVTTLTATGATGLALTGTPVLSGITAVGQVGAVPAGGSANGQMWNINAPSGFTGNLIRAQVNGGAHVFNVNSSGDTTILGTAAVTGASTLTGQVNALNRLGVGTTSTPAATLEVKSVNGVVGTLATELPAFRVSTNSQALPDTTTLTNARHFFAVHPTFTAATGTATITNAATMYIDQEPTASSGASITNAYSIWVDGGNTRLDGDILLDGQAARDVGIFRHLTTHGVNLTVHAGGGASGVADRTGGSLLLQTGLPTGLGKAVIRQQTPIIATATGSSDNTLVDRTILGASKILTNASASSLVSATLASGSVIGGVVRYTVEVTNGTDYQVESGIVTYTDINKAGVFSGNTATKSGSTQAVSAGTLTCTFAITGANPAVLSVNANSSLASISTGYPRITYHLDNLTQQAVVLF